MENEETRIHELTLTYDHKLLLFLESKHVSEDSEKLSVQEALEEVLNGVSALQLDQHVLILFCKASVLVVLPVKVKVPL